MALSPVANTAILVAVGLFISASGLVSYIIFPHILKSQIEKNLVLSPNSEVYEPWRKAPVPIYAYFYFFNVTNPDEILHGKNMPHLEEVGPYVFREIREKTNITWNDGGTVSYLQKRHYFFEPDLTNGTLDDMITTVNVPLAGTLAFANTIEDGYFRDAITKIVNATGGSLFVVRNVSQLLFDGYEDQLVSIGGNLGLSVPYDKFGWFYMKNGSDDGVYTIFTGAKGMKNYGSVDTWNGVNELDIWEGACNNITGTGGDMWPPFKTRSDKLTIFTSDICRSLTLNYLKDTTVYEVETYRYILDETTFDNGRFNKENRCYCTDSCLPPGALNLSSCQHGAPVLLSLPHFLYAHSSYRKQVVGMKPDPEKHKFFIDLEPNLGVPLRVSARLQLNVAVYRFSDIEKLSNIQPVTYYPILWFSESASADVSMAKKLKFVKNDLPHYVTIVSFLLVVIGGSILTSGLLYAVWITKNQKKQKGKYAAVPLTKV